MYFGSEFDKPNFDYPIKFRQETLKVGFSAWFRSRILTIKCLCQSRLRRFHLCLFQSSINLSDILPS